MERRKRRNDIRQIKISRKYRDIGKTKTNERQRQMEDRDKAKTKKRQRQREDRDNRKTET